MIAARSTVETLAAGLLQLARGDSDLLHMGFLGIRLNTKTGRHWSVSSAIRDLVCMTVHATSFLADVMRNRGVLRHPLRYAEIAF